MRVRPSWLPARIADEFRTLLGLGLGAGALLLFALLADEVVEGETHALDEAVLLAFRNPADSADPLGPLWLEIAMSDITGLGSVAVLTLVILASAGFLLIDGKRASAFLLLGCVASGTALSFGLKLGFGRPRPGLVAHLAEVHTLSFPSGHAMLSAVTYLTLGALLARAQPRRRLKVYLMALAVLLTLLIGISRVYLGVHWPTDVLAGWCAGSAWALACWYVALWLQRLGRVEGDAGSTP